MEQSTRTEQQQMGRLAATYSTPNTIVTGGIILAFVPLLLVVIGIILVRGFALWRSTAQLTWGNSGLAAFLLVLVALSGFAVGVTVRLSLRCFRRDRLVVYVYHDGLVLLEGAAWGQKSRRAIHWDQITKVHLQRELRDRVFYRGGYSKWWPPIVDEIPHYTLQLKDGTQIKLPEDMSEVTSLMARIEAVITPRHHK